MTQYQDLGALRTLRSPQEDQPPEYPDIITKISRTDTTPILPYVLARTTRRTFLARHRLPVRGQARPSTARRGTSIPSSLPLANGLFDRLQTHLPAGLPGKYLLRPVFIAVAVLTAIGKEARGKPLATSTVEHRQTAPASDLICRFPRRLSGIDAPAPTG